jgi:predicted Zn-dependent peptidase
VAQQLSGDVRGFLSLPERVDAVTSADLQRVAAHYLQPGNRSFIDRRAK